MTKGGSLKLAFFSNTKFIKMIKSVQFKNPSMRLSVPGMGIITNDNITPEKYSRLINLSPAHADLFEVKEDDQLKEKSKSKSTSNELQA
jgi:hypothetical protein